MRGQYAAGAVDGEPVVGYREEEGVDPHSRTETFVALRLTVDNWRWAGVPVYIRTGKRLPSRVTEVALAVPAGPAPRLRGRAHPRPAAQHAGAAHPARRGDLVCASGPRSPARRSGCARWPWTSPTPRPSPAPRQDGYERLLHDAMIGDATLFIRTDEVEQAWRIVDPLPRGVGRDGVRLSQYPAGTWGPHEADAPARALGDAWRGTSL